MPACRSISPTSTAATTGCWIAKITKYGDWRETVDAEPGGWCFEYANDFYPDVDDTAMVSMALAAQFKPTSDALAAAGSPRGRRLIRGHDRGRTRSDDRPLRSHDRRPCDRAEKWMLAMQNRDGGWGAFDRDNDREFLCHVPFADHNAMIDPSTPDLTARVLEALGTLGRTNAAHPAVDEAVDYLCEDAGARWQLVRPLGRELHLRHLAGAGRLASHRRAASTIR